MKRSNFLLRGCALAVGLALMAPSVAFADAESEATDAVADSLDKIKRRNYDEAIAALKKAQVKCLAQTCSSAVKSGVYLSQGIAYASKGDQDEGQKRFEWALTENADAVVPRGYETRKVKNAFAKAKQNVEDGNAAALPTAPKPVPVRPGMSDEKKAAIEEATQKLDDGDWEACMETMIVSTSIEEYSAGKLMLARCEEGGGLLMEARRDAIAAKELAEKKDEEGVQKDADEYLKRLDNITPKIVIQGIKKVGIGEPKVKVDDEQIDADKLGDPIPHNPGRATINIKGTRGCAKFDFSYEVRFERKETLRFDLTKITLPSPFEMCMKDARTPREQRACREKCDVLDEDLNFNGGLELSTYNDNDNVGVFTPALHLAAVHPTQGWHLGGHALVDVVTTASADILATASRRFDDIRFGGGLNAGYKVGGFLKVDLNGGVSLESDYIGRTVGGALSADVWDKMATPYVAYNFGFDILGRADTEFEVFSRDVFRHTINAGTSLIFGKSTVGVIGGTAVFEDGDQSKPYRHVAMFEERFAAAMPKGAEPSLVSAARLDLMPLEQLPTDRQRYALMLRFLHRLDSATIRGSERVYIDSWGQFGSSTDARLLWDFWEAEADDGLAGLPALRLAPHIRFHIQGPTDFWQRAYVAQPSGVAFAIPKYRTGDRELGPLFSGTLGTNLRAQLTELFSLGVTVEGTYTQFQDHLYLFDRWGLFTATTAEIEIQ